jgi:hypothetical protein
MRDPAPHLACTYNTDVLDDHRANRPVMSPRTHCVGKKTPGRSGRPGEVINARDAYFQ